MPTFSLTAAMAKPRIVIFFCNQIDHPAHFQILGFLLSPIRLLSCPRHRTAFVDVSLEDQTVQVVLGQVLGSFFGALSSHSF